MSWKRIDKHGVLSLSEIADLAEKLCPELTAGKLPDTINRSYLLSSSKIVLGSNSYLSSSFVFDPKYTLEMTEERDSLERVHFSIKDVISAADIELPQPPENLANRNFRNELLQIIKDDENVNWWISQFWILLNNDRHPADLIGSFIEVNRLNENETKRFISAFLHWANHSPRWFMKGNPANNSFLSNKISHDSHQPSAMRITSGSNSSVNSYQQKEKTADHTASTPVRPYGRKVGRNDPCPCGSGRKY
jgi:hypothetical protein